MAADMPDAVQKSVVLFPKHCTQKTHDLKQRKKNKHTQMIFGLRFKLCCYFCFPLVSFCFPQRVFAFVGFLKSINQTTQTFCFFLMNTKTQGVLGSHLKNDPKQLKVLWVFPLNNLFKTNSGKTHGFQKNKRNVWLEIGSPFL